MSSVKTTHYSNLLSDERGALQGGCGGRPGGSDTQVHGRAELGPLYRLCTKRSFPENSEPCREAAAGDPAAWMHKYTAGPSWAPCIDSPQSVLSLKTLRPAGRLRWATWRPGCTSAQQGLVGRPGSAIRMVFLPQNSEPCREAAVGDLAAWMHIL